CLSDLNINDGSKSLVGGFQYLGRGLHLQFALHQTDGAFGDIARRVFGYTDPGNLLTRLVNSAPALLDTRYAIAEYGTHRHDCYLVILRPLPMRNEGSVGSIDQGVKLSEC